MLYDICLSGRIYPPELHKKEENWECRLDGRELSIQVVPIGMGTLSMLVDGKSFEVKHAATGEGLAVFIRGTRYEVSVQDPRSWRGRTRAAQDEAGPQKLIAFMPGKVVRVLAREGDTVLSGQGIAV